MTNVSTTYIATTQLPEDLECFVMQVLEEWADCELPPKLPLKEIDVKDFPVVPLIMHSCDDRGEEYALRMVGASGIPPLVCADGILIDGRHRLYAARVEGKVSLQVIDLSQWISEKQISKVCNMGRIRSTGSNKELHSSSSESAEQKKWRSIRPG